MQYLTQCLLQQLAVNSSMQCHCASTVVATKDARCALRLASKVCKVMAFAFFS